MEEFTRLTVENPTIDTYAKKLYLKGQTEQLNKLKKWLSIFFYIHQHSISPHERYDKLFAAILDPNKAYLPLNVSLISWNYDNQIKLAYREYFEGDFQLHELSQ